MATISKSFTAVGSSLPLFVRHGHSFTYSVSGTFVGTVAIEKSVNGGASWESVVSTTVAASGTILSEATDRDQINYRVTCSAFTSGTIVTSIADVAKNVKQVLNDYGVSVFDINEDGISVPGKAAVAGVSTLSGGVAVASGQQTRHTNFQPSSLTAGTSTTPSATTVYLSQVYVRCNCSLTGIAVSNGATVGTNKYVVALLDSSGAVLANSALAGTLTAGADVFQAVPFTAAYAAVGPGVYWIALYVDGTTDRFRTIPAVGEFAGLAGSATGQTFGTVASVTLPTTFTADKGPVAYVY